MNIRILLLCFIIVHFLGSCTSIQDPTLERIENVEILTLNKNKVELNANMILNNPNSFALDLEKADLVAVLEEVPLASIEQTYETSMPPNGEFKMPIYVNMDLEKLYKDNPIKALGKGIQIMSDRQLEITFQGTIHVGKGIAKISVPVDQQEVVEF